MEKENCWNRLIGFLPFIYWRIDSHGYSFDVCIFNLKLEHFAEYFSFFLSDQTTPTWHELLISFGLNFNKSIAQSR